MRRTMRYVMHFSCKEVQEQLEQKHPSRQANANNASRQGLAMHSITAPQNANRLAEPDFPVHSNETEIYYVNIIQTCLRIV